MKKLLGVLFIPLLFVIFVTCSGDDAVNNPNDAVSPSKAKRSTPGLVGGIRTIENPGSDNTVLALTNDALVQYNSGANGNSHQMVKIVNATVQVVAGSLYKIEATFKEPEGPEKHCYIRVWSRPWLENGKQIIVNCDGDDENAKRSKRTVKPLMDSLKIESLPSENASEELKELLFNQFQRKYDKVYLTKRHRQYRKNVFKINVDRIDEMNRSERGTAKYGINEFADLTYSEFKQYRTGLLKHKRHENDIGNPMAEIEDSVLPESFDWRDQNVVTQVKNQGNCGSCWAFSAIGNIESLAAIKTGRLAEFSEQELVDCDTVDSACNGGLPENAYKSIESLGGLEYEEEYPYTARKSECKFNKTMAHVKVKGGLELPKNETQLAQFLIQHGPISVGLNANAMQFYKSGVSHPIKILCSPRSINHGVVIVGFGVAKYPLFNKTLPYWIIKNSWGDRWGERGYYRIYRGDNTCGINSLATSAVLE